MPESNESDKDKLVTAMTYESDEYDRPAREVTGKLYKSESPFDGDPQCFIGNIQVDPSTVKLADDPASPETPPESPTTADDSDAPSAP